jgi:hypothetical protein
MPATFTWNPNYVSDLTETADSSLEFKTLGRFHAQSVNGEAVTTISFTAAFLLKRTDLKALMAFWRARNGQYEAFQAAAFWTPGSSTSYAPHNFDGTDEHGLVRFASDEIEVRWLNSYVAEVEIEFHQVFTSVEGDPVPMLYRLWTDTGIVEYLTDWMTDVVIGDITYKSARIEHDEIKLSLELQNETCKVDIDINDSDIAYGLCKNTIDGGSWIEVSEYNLTTLTRTSVFVGRIGQHDDEGSITSVEATLYGGKLDMQFPRILVSRTCMYNVFNPGCTRNNSGMAKVLWKTTGEYLTTWSDGKVLIDNLTFPASFSWSANYFTYGWATTGSGATYQARPVTFSAYVTSVTPHQVHIIPLKPFRMGEGWLNTGDTINLYPGCDGNFSTCVAKFNNGIDLMATPFVPTAIKGHTTFSGGGVK